MPDPKGNDLDAVIAAARQAQRDRARGYRARALELFPHVCAHCGRGFDAYNLQQLTVHHKDHNHDHNPPDGSNWELLCIYCHDNAHQRDEAAAVTRAVARTAARTGGSAASPGDTRATYRPFADLVSPAAGSDEPDGSE